MGSHSLVFATLAEAQEQCDNLPQRPESIKMTESSFCDLIFIAKKYFWIPAKSDCVGITYVPSSYPFNANNPALPPAVGFYIRTGPKLEQSIYSEITYLRKLTPVVTMTKPTFIPSEDIEFHFISPYYANEDQAWVGIVPASIPHGSEWENKNHVVSFQNLEGSLQVKFEMIRLRTLNFSPCSCIFTPE